MVALEPEEANYQVLLRNLARNAVTNVEARRVAVGDRPGTMPLYLSDDNRGDHRLFEGLESRDAQTIEVTTLDAILAGIATGLTLIKCDTQGSEWSVVQGMDPTRFDASRCAWIVEFWPYGLDGTGRVPVTWWHGSMHSDTASTRSAKEIRVSSPPTRPDCRDVS